MDLDDKLWSKWLVEGIDKMSFETYKSKHYKEPSKPEEEVLNDSMDILKSISRG